MMEKMTSQRSRAWEIITQDVQSKFAKQDKARQWLLTNNFCIMPFAHTAIDSNGDVRPCCNAAPLQDMNGRKLNMNDMSLSEALHHPAYEEFRNSFRKNQRPKNCQICWDDSSMHSLRVKFSSTPYVVDETIKILAGNEPVNDLRWLEIKAGNRCNLRCRICHYGNSSQWLKDTYEIHKAKDPSHPSFKETQEYHWNMQSKWIDDVSKWDDTIELDNLNLLHIMGGEPMSVPEHKRMLQKLIELGRAPEIIVRYNTNATIKPDAELIDLLDNFIKIEWQLSIDDIKHRFEYQRKNGKWEDVANFLDYMQDVYRGNWEIQIDPAVSIFNVIYLNELLDYFGQRNLYVGFNHYVPGPYDIRALSPDCKDRIRQHYATSIHYENDLIVNMLKYLDGDYHNQSIVYERDWLLNKLDDLRGESFAACFPEMMTLLHE